MTSKHHIQKKKKKKKLQMLRPETIKLLDKNISSTLSDIGLGNIFLDLSPQVRATKQK